MKFIISLYFFLKTFVHEILDFVLDPDYEFSRSCIFFILLPFLILHHLAFCFNLNVILTLVLSDHLNLFHFNLHLFSFFFRIFNMWASLFLRFSGFLLTNYFGGLRRTFLLKVKSLQNLILLSNRANLQLNNFLRSVPINQDICAFAILPFLPIILIIVSEGSTKALALNIVGVESIDDAIIILKPLSIVIFNVTDIMTLLCISNVADNACQFILIIRMLLHKIWVVFLFFIVVVKSVGV